jgi:hypothetical protein
MKGKKKMARFNLADYETVEERLKRAHATYEDLRITTEWQNFDGYIDQQSPATYIIKACVYLTAGDQANGLPKATGYAVEIDGTGGANNGSALENAETSAIGRALANMNLSGNKRTSREEMSKVARIENTDWLAELSTIADIKAARALYARAMSQGAPAEVVERIKAHGESLATGSKG